MIYLDNAATTFPKPEEVYKCVDYVQRNLAVNIGRGSYSIANAAMQIVDETRFLLAQMVGIDNPNNVVFTPSATVAANEVIHGLSWDEYTNVYITPFEHNAVARPLEQIRREYKSNIHIIPVDPKTQELELDRMEIMFAKEPPDYIFINHISNVTGAVLPIHKIAESANKYGATIIVDGSQSIGLIDVNMKKEKIDYLIFAGHKNLYASWGVGGFIARNKPTLKPFITGGTGSDSLNLTMGDAMPIMYEPGSSNIISIASLNAALKWLDTVGLETIRNKKKHLMSELVEGLNNNNCTVYLPGIGIEHMSVLSFNVHGYTAKEVGEILNQDYDIGVRTGFHCSPYVHKLLDTEETGGTVRASIGYFNSPNDIKALVKAVNEL